MYSFFIVTPPAKVIDVGNMDTDMDIEIVEDIGEYHFPCH